MKEPVSAYLSPGATISEVDITMPARVRDGISRAPRVTVVGINYAPEPTGIAVYTAGAVRGLDSEGFEVTAITGVPHYPQWKIYPGYDKLVKRELDGGARVMRLRHYVPSKPRLVNRVLLELSFGALSVLAGWRKPDVVVLVSPALFSTGVAMLKAKLLRVPTVVWVQDIYSLGLSETGRGGGLGSRVVGGVERRVLRSADRVIAIHDRFKRFLVDDMGVDENKVDVVRNWSHVEMPATTEREATRLRHGWAENDIVVLHAGNMGAKQGLENVVHASRVAHEQGSRVHFVLLGDGNQRADLEAMGANPRLQFIDPLPDGAFEEALVAADVLLVNERGGVTEHAVPSKMTTYFSTGLPVIAATDAGSITAEEIERSGAGIRVDADSPAALVAGAERLGDDPDAARALGESGLRFKAGNLTAAAAVKALSSVVLTARGTSGTVTG